MKRVIRGLLKIPLTPFVVAWCLLIIACFYAILLFQWVYESSDFHKYVTQCCIDDQYSILQKWFTKV